MFRLPGAPPIKELIMAMAAGVRELVVVCAWCGQLKQKDGTYAEADPAMVRDYAKESHGICQACSDMLIRIDESEHPAVRHAV